MFHNGSYESLSKLFNWHLTLNQKLAWLASREHVTLNLDPWKFDAYKLCGKRDATFINFYNPVNSVCSYCYRKKFFEKQPLIRDRHYDALLTKIDMWLAPNISIVSEALSESKFNILSVRSPPFRVQSPVSRVQRPAFIVQRPTLASRVQELQYTTLNRVFMFSLATYFSVFFPSGQCSVVLNQF